MTENLVTTEPDDLSNALPEEKNNLSAKIAAALRYRKEDRKRLLLLLVSIYSLGFLCTTLFHRPNDTPLISSVAMVLIYIYQNFFLPKRKKTRVSLKKEEIEVLFQTMNKQNLGVLLDFSRTENSIGYSSQIEASLREWLPRFTSEDAKLLNREQKKLLFSYVQPKESSLNLIVLEALAKVGVEETLRSLKPWKVNYSIASKDRAVWDAVDDCIAAIEARLAANRSDAQLLRPSSPAADPKTLLRPLTRKPDDNSETLLRAEIGKREE